MIDLNDLRFIEGLSRAGSLSAAARMLDVTPPALSMRLKKLEGKLKVPLVVRSSRHIRFTEEGERLVAEAQQLIARIDALPAEIAGNGQGLVGRLHVVSSFGFGRAHIAPLISEFSKMHPHVRITLDLTEKPWSQIRNADVVIHIGEVRDSSWVAHVLARNQRWICASPAYLDRFGAPKHPRDLAAHHCLCLRENEEDATLWHFRERTKTRQARRARDSIRVTPVLTSNDGEVVRNWALAGCGVIIRSEWDVAPFVRNGALRRILTDWDFIDADVLALVPARQDISARVAHFIAFLEARFSPRPPWQAARRPRTAQDARPANGERR
jgi:DNA-binding transcriptional LysR family regulator